MFKETFKKKYTELYAKATKNWGRTYIIVFNIYAWYWLIAHIGWEHAGWEPWLQWFFATSGMNFFYQDKKKEYRFGPK